METSQLNECAKKILWIQHAQNKAKIEISNTQDIYDLIQIIRKSKDIQKELGIPADCGTIKLYISNKINTPAIEADVLISALENSNHSKNPLFLKFQTSRHNLSKKGTF